MGEATSEPAPRRLSSAGKADTLAERHMASFDLRGKNNGALSIPDLSLPRRTATARTFYAEDPSVDFDAFMTNARVLKCDGNFLHEAHDCMDMHAM